MNCFDYGYLDNNLSAVRARIKNAAESANRDADSVLLLAAVKYASAEEINYLCKTHGVCDVGENRVNTLLEHYERTDNSSLRYHFIGSLQKNKVKYIYDKICLLHSLDSLSLAEEIEKRCAKDDIVLDCLIEINIAEEESKGGIAPSLVAEFAESVTALAHINIKGFMTMAPAWCSKEEYETYFSKAAKIMNSVWKDTLKRDGEPFISMGMSASIEPAIKEGSSCVRIGSDIFRH